MPRPATSRPRQLTQPARAPGRRRAALAVARAALAGGLGACASAGSPPVVDPYAGVQASTRIHLPQGTVDVTTVSDAPRGEAIELRAGADRVFAALPGVYEELKVPVNTMVSADRVLGGREVRVPRRLGNVPVTQLVDCGSDPNGAPLAATYEVWLTAVSQVTPGGPGASTLLTQVVASARPVGTSSTPVRCRSTGRLERRIHEVVAERTR